MALNTIKFSAFQAATLTNTTNMLVGVSSPSGGYNFQQPATVMWTDATRPGTPYNGLEGYNTTRSQYEYWNGSNWIQLAAGGTGTINTGAQNQVAYYSAAGSDTVLSGESLTSLCVIPQVTVYTSGSGSYTPPSGCLYFVVELVGGGGGGLGGSSGSNTQISNPIAGGNTTFGTAFLVANGGGISTTTYQSGIGGTASGGDINISGDSGGPGSQNNGTGTIGQVSGGIGGSSFFGGAGRGGWIGLGSGGNAATNSGSGGGGGGMNNTAGYVSGGGGGAGGYCKKTITSISGPYAYGVGAGGSGGTASSSGGNGAAGQIIITAYFQ